MKDKIPVVLSVAGSDSGGGAGIQADLKTFTALGTFGTTAITSITSQNLAGVRSIQAVRPEIVGDQIAAVCEGFPVRVVKTGMLYSHEIIEIVAAKFRRFNLRDIVVDPVFAATSGAKLIEDDGIDVLTKKLFPMARIITPNIPEAEFLTGMNITGPAEMHHALDCLMKQYPGPVFVLKGGHLDDDAVDIFGGGDVDTGELKSGRADDLNNHGSGCSFASAIAAFLAHGYGPLESLKQAKEFISGALHNPLCLQNGVRLIDHFWKMGL